MKMLTRSRWWFGFLIGLLLLLTACQVPTTASKNPTSSSFVSPGSDANAVTSTPVSIATEAAAETPTEAPAETQEAQAETSAEASEAPTPTPAFTATPATGRIAGWVWEDHCTPILDDQGTPTPGHHCQETPSAGIVGDGLRQPDEPALAGVVVTLSRGDCPGTLLSKTVTNAEGYYQFSGLPEGTYCIAIDATAPQNAPLLKSGVWTQPKIDKGEATVTLDSGGVAEVDFARTPQVAETTQPSSAGTAETTPTVTDETASTAAAIEAPDAEKPYALGEPDMRDTMDLPGEHWYTLVPPAWEGWLSYTVAPGSLVMQVHKTSLNNYWLTSNYPALENAYLEATFITGSECARKDRYGVVVRGPHRYEGVVFLISCDGMYKIFRWNGGLKLLRNWTRTPAIHTGGKQVNRVGVWMEGDTLKLYINHSFVDEVEETLFKKGVFGLVVGAEATPNFEVRVDEVDYWLLP